MFWVFGNKSTLHFGVPTTDQKFSNQVSSEAPMSSKPKSANSLVPPSGVVGPWGHGRPKNRGWWCHCGSDSDCSNVDYYQWIGLREIFNRKAPYLSPMILMGKSMVSCKFSLKPIHWYYVCVPIFVKKSPFQSQSLVQSVLSDVHSNLSLITLLQKVHVHLRGVI